MSKLGQLIIGWAVLEQQDETRALRRRVAELEAQRDGREIEPEQPAQLMSAETRRELITGLRWAAAGAALIIGLMILASTH